MATIFRTSGLILIVLLLGVSLSIAADFKPHKVGPKDKCPVCGMFVAKYPDFAVQIQFRDGSTAHFDGAKDMFKYYLNVPGYTPGKKSSDITAIYVTNYYDLALVNGLTAHYVIGSDVYGPMGRELIPFAKGSEAREFMKDHRGTAIVRFNDVGHATLKPLD